ncbi:MAG: hypothetical protein AAGB48_13210 [Planctomycetota bacterium]
MLKRRIVVCSAAVLSATAASMTAAQPVTIASPAVDRWNSAASSTPGFRPTASAFGASGQPGFEDYFVTHFMIFDSSSAVAAGLGVSNYVINSASVTLARDPSTTYTYDPTVDSLDALNGTVADDAGRPIELFGTGFRGGFDSSTYVEGSAMETGTPWGPAGSPFAPGVRFAYPTDAAGGSLRDVSSHIQENIEVSPFAVGAIDGLSAGDTVSGPGEMVFDLQLTPDVVLYLQQGLDIGLVGFHAASHAIAGGAGDPIFPSFYNKESGLGSASLTFDVTIIPAPGGVGLLLLSSIGFSRRRPSCRTTPPV